MFFYYSGLALWILIALILVYFIYCRFEDRIRHYSCSYMDYCFYKNINVKERDFLEFFKNQTEKDPEWREKWNSKYNKPHYSYVPFKITSYNKNQVLDLR